MIFESKSDVKYNLHVEQAVKPQKNLRIISIRKYKSM